MAERSVGATEAATQPAAEISPFGGAAAYWRNTLWAMAGIQFVMTMAFSMLSPIMPLFLSLSTPSTGRNNGMIGDSIENAIVMTNWMPAIAHSVFRQ